MGHNKSSFFNEFVWISFSLVAALLLGYSLGYPWFFFSIGLLIYIFWNIRQLVRLVHWLSKNELDLPPDASGIWGDIFRHLYRIQRNYRHRQEKLLVVLNRYKESTEAMPDGTVILGRNWEIEWFNSKCETYFGLQKNQDVGQPLTNLIRNPVLLEFMSTHASSPEKDSILEIPSVNNEKMLSIRLVPYGKSKYLLIARDISSIIKLKAMRKDFVANVSHELRTPLTVVSGYLETMHDHLKDDPMYDSSIQAMQQQASRMGRIVADLLLLSKIESNEKIALAYDYVDIPALLSMLKKEAIVLSAGKHKINVICDEPKWLRGNINELQSAFSNLISNAIRYTPETGEISIKWYLDNQHRACFEVRDSGEGIESHHLERLTERFYRVDVGRSRTTGGTGLGLAIVKHVLANHESKLLIESKIGIGSVFRCVFPEKMIKEQ